MNRLQAQIDQISKTPGQIVDQALSMKYKTAQTNCGARQSALQSAQQSFEAEKTRGANAAAGRVTATTIQQIKGKIEVKTGVITTTTAASSSSSSPGTPVTPSPAAVDVKVAPAEVAPISCEYTYVVCIAF